MKNNIFSKSIKYVAALALLAMLGLLPSTPTEAQTVQSAQYVFPTTTGRQVIVRESDAGVPVISYRKEGPISSGGGAHFVYGDIYSSGAKDFIIRDSMTVNNNSIRYVVNDMRVVGDMCYFCGCRECNYGEPDPWTGGLVTDSIGILGRFRLDPSGTMTLSSFDLKLMRETKALQRMAVDASNHDTLLVMTGIVNTPYSTTSASCLAVARVRHTIVPDPWKYNVAYVGNDPDEVFTDLAIDTRYAVIASYRKVSGDKYYFYLRAAKSTDILFDDDYTDFDDRNKYSLADSCIKITRPDNAEVRLSAVPWDKKVYASFMCSMNPCKDSLYNTAMCEIATNSMNLENIQVVQKIFSTPHTLVDTKYLYKTYGDASTAFVALLHQPDGRFGTVVEYPHALTSSYPYTEQTALVQRLADYKISSVSALNGSVYDVRFGGVRRSSTIPTYLQEILPSLYDNSQCMQNSEADVLVIPDLIRPDRITNMLISIYEDIKALGWDTKPTNPESVDVDNICIY